MAYESIGPISVEQRLSSAAKVYAVGDPFSTVFRTSTPTGRVARARIKVIAPFRYLGIETEAGQALAMDNDLAEGLRQTGHLEILEVEPLPEQNGPRR
jgi:hypothetical protein